MNGSELTLIGVLVLLFSFGLKVAALGIIPGGRRPSTGVAWLLIIMLNSFVGFMAFLFFGSTGPGRRRHERIAEVNRLIAERAGTTDGLRDGYDGPAYVHSVARLNRTLGSLPVVNGNQVELIHVYEDSMAAMAAAIDTAEHYVHVQFYISAWDDLTDQVLQAMARAAARGVTVRFLFDHLGSRGIPGFKEFQKRLDGTGIEWHKMLPIKPLQKRFRRPDLRNHRKMLIVDGRVGFTGSMNLTEPGYNKPKNHELGRQWVELMARLHGPVVGTLNAVFASDWFIETDMLLGVDIVDAPAEPVSPDAVTGVCCQTVPSGPGFVAENNLRLFNTLLYSATKRISLTSPYFVPDESLLYAVTTAAQRGIDIELFVSELSDQFMVGHAQASYYKALLEAGVRIYLYPAPYILHSKHFTIDDDVAVIGSSNMDMRSFSLNYEISLMMLEAPVVAQMRKVEDLYRSLSRELTLEEWSKRKPRLKYVDNVMRLTAALQ